MIRATADAEVRALIDALGHEAPARREAAIARLSILGRRAVSRLIGAYDATTDGARQLAILRVLQTSADERALPIAERALHAGGEIGVAAIALLRHFLDEGSGATHARALELLLAASHDTRLARRIRAAAVDALTSAATDIREALGDEVTDLGSVVDATWDEAVDGCLPDDPAALAEAIDGRAGRAPLPTLLRLIEAVRARECASPERGAEWRAVRGTLHQAAASRGSRVALYDLRETIEAARRPLPSSYLSAVQLVSDPACVESLAAAFSRAESVEWQRQLAAAFHALVRRLRLTKRHAAMRRALAVAPGLTRD